MQSLKENELTKKDPVKMAKKNRNQISNQVKICESLIHEPHVCILKDLTSLLKSAFTPKIL